MRVTDEMVDTAINTWIHRSCEARLKNQGSLDTETTVRAMLEAALADVPDQPPLQLAPGEPQPDAPTDLRALPDYWDERRRRQGKPDLSRCAAELRIALRDVPEGKP